MKNAREIVVSTSIVILPKLASGYSHDYQVQIMHKLSIGLSGSKIEYFQRKDPDGWSDISRISSEKLSDHLAHELLEN